MMEETEELQAVTARRRFAAPERRGPYPALPSPFIFE